MNLYVFVLLRLWFVRAWCDSVYERNTKGCVGGIEKRLPLEFSSPAQFFLASFVLPEKEVSVVGAY